MKLTICAANIDKFVGKLQEAGVISKEWWRDPKYDLWMKYFQIKTDDIAELEDLLEAAINFHATHYILESDDAKEYFDGTPLPKARQDLKERKLKEKITGGVFIKRNLGSPYWYGGLGQDDKPVGKFPTIESAVADGLEPLSYSMSDLEMLYNDGVFIDTDELFIGSKLLGTFEEVFEN